MGAHASNVVGWAKGVPSHADVEPNGGFPRLQPSCSCTPCAHGSAQEVVEGQRTEAGSTPRLDDAHLPHLHGRAEVRCRMAQRRKGWNLGCTRAGMIGRCAIPINQVSARYGHHRSVHLNPHVQSLVVVRKAFRAGRSPERRPKHGVPRGVVGFRRHLARPSNVHHGLWHGLTTWRNWPRARTRRSRASTGTL